MNESRVLKLLWEKSDIGLCTVSREGKFLQVNSRLCELLEYTPVELAALKFQDVTAPQDLEADVQMTRLVVMGEVDSYRMRKTYVKKSGYPLVADVIVHPVTTETGEVELFLSQVVPTLELRPRADMTTVDPLVLLVKWAAKNKKLVATWAGAIAAALSAFAATVHRLLETLSQ